ncbi:MAG: Abi-alpha family protein [Gammaproteobacteria bacterium]|nr:Abi-alpha family protein [Gammaproteobacteria bacterium]
MTEELQTVQEMAKAVQETAKAAGKTLDVIHAGGSYIGEALGAVPADLIGVIGGDWLREARIRNLDRLQRRTDEILQAREVQQSHPDISPSVLIPIAVVASAESRDELQELFARLLANAADPERQSRVRREFIDMVSQMEPLDARLLLEFSQAPKFGEFIDKIRVRFPDAPTIWSDVEVRTTRHVLGDANAITNQTDDAVDLARDKLRRLKCIEVHEERGSRESGNILPQLHKHCSKVIDDGMTGLPDRVDVVSFTTLGREFLRALEL